MRFSIQPALSRALAGATLALGLVACGGNDSNFEVNTTLGAVSGTETASSYAYLGIPYAAPPVGNLRWRAPAAATPWSGTRSGANYAPHCAQPASAFGSASTSEDCLYLNVYTPKGNGTYPVMVWIHGGAFYLGLSNAFDPSALVAKGVVVVTINYRLGALGFMSHAALTAEQSGSSGNYGLMDQQAALRWVRSNIANFGGNANNITIVGESAGGFSVHSHVASAGSAGLFHKAIAMSGAYPFGAPQDSLAVAQLKGAGVATAVAAATSTTACTTVECLRALPVSALLTAQASVYPSGPVPSVDGSVLAANVRTTIAAGTHNRVPMIEGTTRDEWRLFVALDEYAAGGVALADNAAHIAKVTALLGGALNPAAGPTATALVNGLYSTPSIYPSASLAYGALGTDMVFACNGRIAALELQQHAPVYAYEFRDRTAPSALPPTTFSLGAYHGSELQYIFPSSRPLTAEQQALAGTMTSYWTNFMKTGNPNGTGVPAWAAFTAAADGYQGLDIASGGGVAALGTNFATSHNCTALNQGVPFTPTP
ncbi:MAG: carboxylesterase family protein [Rhizobacter sp.]|nr:carboxylesterase family protein [Rhizobacter sp.]